MADATKAPELVEVKLDRTFTTNGYVYGYEDENGNPVKLSVTTSTPRGRKYTFTGRALVDPEMAEDLERRQAEYRAYEASLNQNHGQNKEQFV